MSPAMPTLSNRDGRNGEHRGFWIGPTQYMPFALTQHSIFSRPILIRIRETQAVCCRRPLVDHSQGHQSVVHGESARESEEQC
jgi:hypothetical protein